jgi:dipeptidyl aminopeptidase/acylaminoacyl peptidase
MIPAVKGSYERQFGSPYLPNVYRELMLADAKDIGRVLDYVATRNDVDSSKVAYFGVSLGAVAGPIITTVQPRFAAAILMSGGLFSWRHVTPEVDAFNFAPRATTPTLMINGRNDSLFPYEKSQRAMFVSLGAREKKHVVYESGHLPTQRDEWVREILTWLDRYLGPVNRI